MGSDSLMSGHAVGGDGQVGSGDAAAPGGAQASRPDGKDAGAFRTIGEVTRALSIAPHVLRYWEEQFPMLRPVKRSGGRRYYRPEDMALLEEIHRLVHQQGYTLRGARKALEDRDKAPVVKARASLLEDLVALRADLASLLEG